ncbi:MAG: hypothetical protein HC828_13110 [Blastochloris sp.]|nr:hypothetical protein [Blastochloris sp.]
MRDVAVLADHHIVDDDRAEVVDIQPRPDLGARRDEHARVDFDEAPPDQVDDAQGRSSGASAPSYSQSQRPMR